MEPNTTYGVDLSPFDQTIPRLYVHKLFCFPFSDSSRQAEAVESIERGLSATILKWPSINGRVSPAKNGIQHNAVQLYYITPAVGEIQPDLLTVRTLSATEFPWTYQQLVNAGMPPSAMKMEILSSVPEWPKPEETYPALAIQASFIDGGLIICFAFHHAVADGGSFCTFLKAFAASIKTPASLNFFTGMGMQKRIAFTTHRYCDVIPLNSLPEYDFRNAPVRSAASKQITHRILTFKATTVQYLEEAIKEELKKNPSGPTWASNIACLSSLIWVAVVRARQARLQPEETTKIGIAVNIRSVMDPKLPEDYFGNAIVHTNATARVSELLPDAPLEKTLTQTSDEAVLTGGTVSPSSEETMSSTSEQTVSSNAGETESTAIGETESATAEKRESPTNEQIGCSTAEHAEYSNTEKVASPITMAELALGALRMRQAVQGVDKNYVNERLKTFSALSDPTEVSRAYTRAMDTSNTGLDFSSWRDQGADIEFGIPGTGTSSVAWWRKTWSPNEGAYNILPRKGGSKGTADWEVSLGLSVEDMEKVCSDDELGGWVSRIVE